MTIIDRPLLFQIAIFKINYIRNFILKLVKFYLNLLRSIPRETEIFKSKNLEK